MYKKIVMYVSLLFSFQCLLAQDEFNVTIIYDRQPDDSLMLRQSIKAEIELLLGANYQLSFEEFYTGGDINLSLQFIDKVYNQNKADVLIGAGLITSQVLSGRENFPLPTIAAININNLISGDSESTEITSSIHNFTFIQSPFSIENDLETLIQISKAEKVVLLVNPVFKTLDQNIKKYLTSFNIDIELVNIETDPKITLDAIDETADAAYMLSPLSGYTPAQSEVLFHGIAEKKIPCFSILDYPMLDYGAYAAYSSQKNFQKIPRRIALDVSKIAEGINPKDLPVQMETSTRQLLINMETVKKTGIYPNWDILDNALLVNVYNVDTERKINLKSAIAEGLENNLGYKAEQKQSQIAKKEVSLAKSNYLPQVEATSTGLFLDEQTVTSAFGTKGTFNWSSGASFSQLILSEPALANISIQKLMMESQKSAEKQTELDVVLDVATAYFNYLQVQSLVELQNENIKVKQQNLNIAINKEKVGYSGESDIYRWETELAFAKTDYNAATAQLKTVQYQLNQTLNRPVNEEFSIEKPKETNLSSELLDQRSVSLIENPGTLQTLADFMVMEAMNNLPEINQVELTLKAQERLLQSNSRASYIPTVAFRANYDHPLKVVNPGEQLPIPGIDISPNPTWNAAIVVSFPIFTGGSKKYQKEKTQIGLYQLQDKEADVRNKLELQVRANLERLQTSYRNISLTGNAAKSAKKNVDIVQDLYNEGQLSVTNLIDAQNAYLGAETNATNAQYQFMLDLYTWERSIGNYLSLATEEQHVDFINRFVQYQNNK